MGKLLKYANKSNLMNIEIRIGAEKFKFNLYEELSINNANINDEITIQPQVYGFLGMVVAKLVKALEEAEANKKRISAKLYLKYKDQKAANTGRPNSDDVCKALVENSGVYKKYVGRYLLAKEQLQTIQHSLEAFKQRKDLLQTLSSNNRSSS